MLRAGCRRVVGGFASVGVGIRPGHSLPEAEFPASFVKAERGESDAGVGAVGGIVLFIEQLRHEAAKHSAGTDGADGYGEPEYAARKEAGPVYSTGGRDSRSFAAGDLFRSGQFGAAISAGGDKLAGRPRVSRGGYKPMCPS